MKLPPGAGSLTTASLVWPWMGSAKSVPSGLTEIEMSFVGISARPAAWRTDVTVIASSLADPPGPVTWMSKPVVETKPLAGAAGVNTSPSSAEVTSVGVPVTV